MSIWSSLPLEHDELWALGYAPPGADHTDRCSFPLTVTWGENTCPVQLDVATATPWYGNTGVRLTVTDEDGEACVVVPRATAVSLRDALTAWLDETASLGVDSHS